MSDLDDLDHEPETVTLDEEPHSEAHMEEELSAPADGPDAEFSAPPMRPAGSALVKIAIVAVVLIGGGAYFVLSSHQSAPVKEAILSQPVAKQPPLKNAKPASAPDPVVWNGSTTPAPYPPPVAPAPAVPAAAKPLAAVIPAPAAIPTIPAIPPASGQQAATPFAAPSPMPPSSMPSIVNDMPPPMTPLANAGGAMPPTASAPAKTAGSVMPDMLPSPIPAAAPPAAPAATAPTEAQANTPTTLSPFMPEGMPPPVQKQTVQQPAVPQPVVQQPAVKSPQIKNGEPMPSATVAAVDKMEISKTPAPAMPSAESAKVQALENEVADLKKTISQLQQASVMKEDTVGKAVEKTAEGENAEEPAPAPAKASHHTSHHKPRHVATAHHVTAAKWVLKAAKPGVAWVAKKGSSDISMVEPGNSLTGIGRVTSITRGSSGSWVVSGTKGRISQ